MKTHRRRISFPRALVAMLLISGPLLVGAEAHGAADPNAIQEKLNQTAAAYGRLEIEFATTQDRIAKLEKDLAEADATVARYGQTLRERAGWLYRSGGSATYVEGLLTATDLSVFVKRIQLLARLGNTDSKLVEGLKMTKARAGILREQLDVTKSRQQKVLSSLSATRRQLEVQFRGAKAAARIAKYGDFETFTLPILGPVAFANTWNAPRSGGRRHKGTDVMAPCGAQVVAVTNGVIIDMHSGGAGGIMLWLRASNGDVFFYSHLQKYAGSAYEGKYVSTGELIAYNGNTGNARGGPCHVHFEWHPDGGAAVNPYPLLRAVAG